MIGLDEHATRTSPVHRWDPRYKIVGLTAVAFAFAAVREVRLLPAMVAAAAALVVLARLPWSFVARRLRYPGVVVVGLGLTLPLASGSTVLVAVGPLAVHAEGTWLFVLVATRFACIVTVALVMFGTASVLTTVTALRALGVPALMTDMALLAYRYLHVLAADLATMQRAARLRGFVPRARPATLRTLSSLIASLFVRSYERSERLHHAMVLRGWGHAEGRARAAHHEFRTRPGDVVALLAALGVATGFVAAPVIA